MQPANAALARRRPVLLALATLLVLCVVSLAPTSAAPAGAEVQTLGHLRGARRTWDGPLPQRWEVLAIADLDKKSRVAESGKPLFRSLLQRGVLERPADAGGPGAGGWRLTWEPEPLELLSAHNEAGRGMELSELWEDAAGRLFAADDRTGIVFEVDPGRRAVYPRLILPEGDGDTDKGTKVEWATFKGDELFIGSFGKEYTRPDGSVLNVNNMWVSVVDAAGHVRREDWSANFDRLRAAGGAARPGYMIHEAICWSEVHQRWFVLPRRVSADAYDEAADERKGANLMLVAAPDFSNVETVRVGTLPVAERGFSSFKFLPGSRDELILATKSVESEALGTQTTFITVFTLQGEVLMPEVELPGGYKFEGVLARRMS